MLCFTVTPQGEDIVPGFKVEFRGTGRPFVKVGTLSLPFSDELIASAQLTSTHRLLTADIGRTAKGWELIPEGPQEIPSALVLAEADVFDNRPSSTEVLIPLAGQEPGFALWSANAGSVLARLSIGHSIGYNATVTETLPLRSPRNLRERMFGVPTEFAQRTVYKPLAVFNGHALQRV